MFCNKCGGTMAATASSCATCGHSVFPVTTPTQDTSIRTSSLPFEFGRFYAGLLIAGGLSILVFLLLFWNHLYPPLRRMMMITVVVGLPLGYGLWNRARWGLYLLTIVFILEFGSVISRLNHGIVKPVPLLILHAIVLYYCWKRERDFR